MSRRQLSVIACGIAGVVMVIESAALATLEQEPQRVIVHDNLSSGPAPSGAWFGGGRTVAEGPHYVAMNAFTPGVSGWATTVQAYLFSVPGASDRVTLSILDDVGSGRPADHTIYSAAFEKPLAYPSQLRTFDLPEGPWLTAGKRYWVAFDANDNTRYTWSSPVASSGNASGYFLSNYAPLPNGQWQLYQNVGGFSLRVGVLTPEPTTLAGLAGSLGLFARRRRG